MSTPLLIAGRWKRAVLLPAMANRHGLITGATGTGKPLPRKSWLSRCQRLACRFYG